MNVTVIGNGSIGKRHINGLCSIKSEIGLTSIKAYDPNPVRCREAAGIDGIVSSTNNLKEALHGSDAVFICAPTSLHLQVFSDVIDIGHYDIFMEKPLGSSASGWISLIEKHQNSGKKFMTGYMLRHHPVVRRVKEIYESDVLGRILFARAESGFYLPFWHPHEDYREFYMSQRSGGGGALLDTSHELDYLAWILGEYETVNATVETRSDLEISSDDLVIANLKTKSNVRVSVHLDLLQFNESRYCKLVGTKGVVIGDLMNGVVKFNTVDDPTWVSEEIAVSWDKIYAAEYDTFFKLCKGQQVSAPTGFEALHIMEVVEAARMSHSLGAHVTLPLWGI